MERKFLHIHCRRAVGSLRTWGTGDLDSAAGGVVRHDGIYVFHHPRGFFAWVGNRQRRWILSCELDGPSAVDARVLSGEFDALYCLDRMDDFRLIAVLADRSFTGAKPVKDRSASTAM